MSKAKNWSSREIRQCYFDFFKERDHRLVPSAPIVLKDDPSLMFTNAGMNQFKDAFLGNTRPPAPRVTDSQKCLRVSGKHNDLEEVGHDTYHHTMFEMLGNWSFGDYFKKETIAWAWELLTEVYGLDPDRLYATVFEGDEEDALGRDEEAAREWAQWLPAERILEGDKTDNFWEMGASGPCGPSSELHIDLRTPEERSQREGAELVNQDHPQVVEIWNLVFMEYNRKADGSLEKLPAQHVDTGMGFERLCMALQDKRSNYDTDVFQPLISAISDLCGKAYGQEEKTDIALRVIADHVRAVAFAIADGQLPSNTGAGYVIRRILRRAIRYGFSYLQFRDPFVYRLVDLLARQLGEFFPEIEKQQGLVEKVIREEEQSFLRTLEQGLQRLEQMTAAQEGQKRLDGAKVFELYDTYGFPPDLTGLILRERGLDYDEAGYQAEMQKQKKRARAAAEQDTGDWTVLQPGEHGRFVGYDQLTAQARLARYRQVKVGKKVFNELVLDQTPFYPEGGGQVGDQGYLQSGEERIAILDTRREHGLIIHRAERLPSQPEQSLEAVVDNRRRELASLNHSATHLLHQALREVLGDHVEQKGSLVHPDYLRFDFSHFSRLKEEELEAIEKKVNERIRGDFPLEEHRDISREAADQMGAMALFGEKYGERVRVIKFGESVELCGGIHVPSTGRIGLFTLVNEGAVAAGVRRIEALTGERARAYLREQTRTLDTLREELKNPRDVVAAVGSLKNENARLRKQIEAHEAAAADAEKERWKAAIQEDKGLTYLFTESTLEAAGLKSALMKLRGEYPGLAAVVGSRAGKKVQIAVALGDEWQAQKGGHAGKLVKELAAEIRGGGGGQPGFAMAGGSDPEGLGRALKKAKELLK